MYKSNISILLKGPRCLENTTPENDRNFQKWSNNKKKKHSVECTRIFVVYDKEIWYQNSQKS